MNDPYDAALDPGSGVPIVSTRAEEADALAVTVSRWRTAQGAADFDRRTLIVMAREYNGAGWSEYALAAIMGVSRTTVREWLGKGGTMPRKDSPHAMGRSDGLQ